MLKPMPANEQNPAFVCSQKHADLFIGFATFLYQNCLERGLSDLFFCTREGVFFKAVFDALFCRTNESPAVRTHLLEASRLSVFPATVLVDGRLELAGLFRLYKQQSVNTILRSLGLKVEQYADLIARHGLDADRLESEADAMHTLRGFLHDEQFIARCYPELEHKRNTTLGYLSQQFGDLQKIGFVDIGWRGTIQNCIATLMPGSQFIGLYLGLALERNIMRPNCEKIAYGPNQNASREYVDLLHAVNVLEFVCLSTSGSASGYRQSETGEYVANMHIDPQENLVIESFSIPFQQGVMKAARQADPLDAINSHLGGNLKQDAMKHWRKLIRKPCQELVDAYFSLQSNEVFGLGTLADQSKVPLFRNILAAAFSGEKRRQLVRFLTYSQWADGYKRRKDLDLQRRWGLFGLMKAAEKYKYLKLSSQARSS